MLNYLTEKSWIGFTSGLGSGLLLTVQGFMTDEAILKIVGSIGIWGGALIAVLTVILKMGEVAFKVWGVSIKVYRKIPNVRKYFKLFALGMILILLTGCGILNKVKTEKTNSTKDSLFRATEQSITLDTGIVRSYERFSIGGPYHFLDNPQKVVSPKVTVSRSGTKNLKESPAMQKHIADMLTDQQDFMLLLHEKWTEEQKGLSTSSQKQEDVRVKESESIKSKDKQPSILIIISVVFLICMAMLIFKK